MKRVQAALAAVMFLLLQSAYAGEFDDHCAAGLAGGMLIKTKCEINTVLAGKTYCFASEESRQAFLGHPDEMMKQAAEFYAKNPEPVREKISQADALMQIRSQACDLSNKDAGYLEFDGMDLRHCNMVNTSFFGAYLRGANLSGANLERAYLNLARLENADLSHANLKDAIIFQAIFDKTNFKGANLSNARVIGTLGNVDMSEANIVKGRFGLDIGNQPMGAMRFDAVGGNFSNTNFEGADINRNNVRFGNFRNANLRNTNLFRADFSKADLTGADITGADLNEAVLDGTIMTGVKGIEAIKGYDRSKGECVDCKVAP
ncbi:pentapeptide repeat-containing protein [Methylotenera sp. G11]|uniref:pentapeptide repeat-containing protein n=1 Tax=Methylotenera sp. G11 TaxID=1506585 RepID=UPI00068B698C|nr:pentapeptide repeat-containing protein [Methylotenera sp. G11]